MKVCIALVCVKQTKLTQHNNPKDLILFQQLCLEDLRSCIKNGAFNNLRSIAWPAIWRVSITLYLYKMFMDWCYILQVVPW